MSIDRNIHDKTKVVEIQPVTSGMVAESFFIESRVDEGVSTYAPDFRDDEVCTSSGEVESRTLRRRKSKRSAILANASLREEVARLRKEVEIVPKLMKELNDLKGQLAVLIELFKGTSPTNKPHPREGEKRIFFDPRDASDRRGGGSKRSPQEPLPSRPESTQLISEGKKVSINGKILRKEADLIQEALLNHRNGAMKGPSTGGVKGTKKKADKAMPPAASKPKKKNLSQGLADAIWSARDFHFETTKYKLAKVEGVPNMKVSLLKDLVEKKTGLAKAKMNGLTYRKEDNSWLMLVNSSEVKGLCKDSKLRPLRSEELESHWETLKRMSSRKCPELVKINRPAHIALNILEKASKAADKETIMQSLIFSSEEIARGTTANQIGSESPMEEDVSKWPEVVPVNKAGAQL